MPATTPASQASTNPLTYAQSGVDIEAGDRLVDMIKATVRRTHGPRVLGDHGGFAGMFRLDFNERLFKRNYTDPVLVACTDGVGTKVKLACDLQIHHTVGIDCVAMNVNDLIVQGAEPLFFLDYLGLHTQDPEVTARIIDGVAEGCRISDCALLGGECAEMPDIYAPGEYDVAGFAVGVVELARAIDPVRMQPGDVILGLSSSGVHSNGFSLVRAILSSCRLKLDAIYDDACGQGQSGKSLGEVLLEPTRIYAAPIVKLLRRYRVKKVVSGMAHITGGGLAGNLTRVMPPTVDAAIDRSTWPVHPIFSFLKDHGGIDSEEMDRVFNMGLGYVLVVRPTFAESIMRQLEKCGEVVSRIGTITAGTGQVTLTGTGESSRA